MEGVRITSKHVLATLNLLTLLLSIPIMGAGIWLAARAPHTDCVRFLQGPVVAIGLFIFLASLAGLFGTLRHIAWLLWVYLAVLLALLILLFCFTIFAFAVTNKGAGEALSGRVYRDYRLADFSGWLQHRVSEPQTWKAVRSCLGDHTRVCSSLSRYKFADDFYNAELSPVQSGCCKPPTLCQYLFLNATYWTRPLKAGADPDCKVYSYVQSELCFECNSCRAGVLAQVRHDWRKVAAVNIIVLLLLIVVYSVGFHVFRKAQQEGKYTKYGKGFF